MRGQTQIEQKSGRGFSLRRFAGALGALVALMAPLHILMAAEWDEAAKFDIAAQALDTALLEFSKQAGIQVLATTKTVTGKTTQGVKGELVVEKALNALLQGSGLTYRQTGPRAVTVGGGGESAALELGGRLAQLNAAALEEPESEGSDKALSAEGSIDSDVRLEEVVVTAQKRGDERLQDIPVPISVLSATSLIQNGATGLQDYFTKVPGVAITVGGGGSTTVLIRGVATNGQNDNPVVGYTVDDAPYGASTFLGGGLQPVDMDPNELSQIEVLRGPQGTLYGASSLGGLLRYVMVEPSLDKFSGRVMTSGQSTRNGDGLDYSLRGSVNLPINSSLALRVSGFNREEAGYIDDTFSGKEGVNDGHSYGGRAALLWRVNEDWSVKLSAVRQLLETGNANAVDRDPSEEERLKTSDYIPGMTGLNRSVSFFTGRIEGSISNIDLTSISAYTRTHSVTREGLTRGGLQGLVTFLEPSADAGLFFDVQEVSKFSQEIRANIPITDRVDWLVGAFYTREKGDFWERILAGDRATGDVVNNFTVLSGQWWSTYTETAAFTNLTVRFTDRFDVQFGARASENRQEVTQEANNPPLLGGYALTENRSKDNPITYLITPRFKLTDEWMVYSRIATGYRAGGPSFNSQFPGAAPLKADTTENYELGVKGDLFDRRLSIDASAYYIDWKDIPVGVLAPGQSVLGYNINAAGAISKGLELSFALRPVQGLTLSAWGAWSDAYISELPADSTASFDVGDRLPYSPRFSGNASIDYERSLFGAMIGNVGASVRYVGDRVAAVGFPDDVLTNYSQVDAHVGVQSGSWTVNAFINNITDERGRVGVKPLLDNPPQAVTIIRPRTIGLSVAKDF